MSINTELQLFRFFKGTYLEPMIERSVYNKRLINLFNYTESIQQKLSEHFAQFTDVFIIDSMSTPICKYTRAGRSTISSTYEIKPSYGYCTSKSNYFGYKLHAVCDKNGVSLCFDLTPAHIHDVNYLNQVKHNLDNLYTNWR